MDVRTRLDSIPGLAPTPMICALSAAGAVLTGAVACNAQGVPVLTDHVEMLIPDSAVDRVAAVLASWHSWFRDERGERFASPETLREFSPATWSGPGGPLRMEIVDDAAVRCALDVRLEPGPYAPRSEWVLLMPLVEIERHDAEVARLVQRMRARAREAPDRT
jgi:hypothetical protein